MPRTCFCGECSLDFDVTGFSAADVETMESLVLRGDERGLFSYVQDKIAPFTLTPSSWEQWRALATMESSRHG